MRQEIKKMIKIVVNLQIVQNAKKVKWDWLTQRLTNSVTETALIKSWEPLEDNFLGIEITKSATKATPSGDISPRLTAFYFRPWCVFWFWWGLKWDCVVLDMKNHVNAVSLKPKLTRCIIEVPLVGKVKTRNSVPAYKQILQIMEENLGPKKLFTSTLSPNSTKS